jgi:2-methylcitrate dehydratase PrpD
MINGVLAHTLDYDDTHLPSILHPSASVVPAVLAAAQAAGVDGARVAAGVAVGLEVAVRIGMAGYDSDGRQSEYFEHGQHATSMCGAIGSAGAVAAMLAAHDGRPTAMCADAAAHAMAIACSMASGIIEANRTGGTVKRLHCGWAAQAGVTAAHLALAGITGAPTALEGRFGFFQAFLRDRWSAAAITDGLGDTWCAAGIFYKPYPANHFTHAGIDAAVRVRARLDAAGVSLDSIDTIELGVASATVRTIGEPLAVKQAPTTGYQGQFSGPYTVVAALLGGGGLGLGLGDFTDDLVSAPLRRRLMARVTVVGDARCDDIYPSQFPAVLTVRVADGREYVEEVWTNRGGPQRPLSDAELARKFADNVEGLLDAAAAAQIVASVGGLSELVGVDEIMTPLMAAGPRPSDSSRDVSSDQSSQVSGHMSGHVSDHLVAALPEVVR